MVRQPDTITAQIEFKPGVMHLPGVDSQYYRLPMPPAYAFSYLYRCRQMHMLRKSPHEWF